MKLAQSVSAKEIMFQFPQWSDLGKTSQISRGMWEEMQARIEEYRSYYIGEIFNEKVPLEEPTADAPLMYPAGLNIVRMIVQAQADALFGEYEDDIITYEPTGEETADSSITEAIRLLQGISRNSNLNAKLWEAALDRELYGGAVFKVTAVHEEGRPDPLEQGSAGRLLSRSGTQKTRISSWKFTSPSR